MIFIERYPLKRCQGCVKLIASKVNSFLNINDLSEVQLCMSSNSWTWECPHTKDGADHVPLLFLSSVPKTSVHFKTSVNVSILYKNQIKWKFSLFHCVANKKIVKIKMKTSRTKLFLGKIDTVKGFYTN